ncbi:MAG: GGDEF domain-containing protein [Deltaproteobacteria bacterium]|nr:GGDEF domain-containing protein [Deltaproteobacteria bacterium]
MPLDAATKNQLSQFGRTIALLFNRSMMYQPSHPFVEQSIDMFYEGAVNLLKIISPVVFILNREEFFVDEEPLDSRLNVSRLALLFKTNGIQSISIEPGLERREIKVFLEVFGNLNKYDGAEGFKKAIFARGVVNIKVNHVRYKKVTDDDEVIARDALKDLTPQMLAAEDEAKTRKMFMDTLLESVLTEEFAKTLNIESLMANPGAVSKNMIQADLEQVSAEGKGAGSGVGSGTGNGTGGSGGGTGAGDGSGGPGTGSGDRPGGGWGPGGTGDGTGEAGTGTGEGGGTGSGAGGPGGTGPGLGTGDGGGTGTGSGGGGAGTGSGPGGHGGSGTGGHGNLLFQQLEVMRFEVEKHLEGKGDVAIADLAGAVFDMKKQLLEGIEAQKALGVAYENEAAILENANELTDRVLIQLVRDEYQQGKITPARMAHILRRLVPEAVELKRLLPKIKKALLEEGMSHTQYLELIQALGKELQSEGLANILQESGEEIGVDGDQLIAEFKNNPEQAAQLIYLAAEIRKGSGDEDVLADILAGYVEQMGGQMAMDQTQEKDDPEHLKKVVGSIESNIVSQLGKMDVGGDVIAKLEDRLNARMETVLDQMRAEWIKSKGQSGEGGGSGKPHKVLSVLQTLEQSVSEHDELGEILKIVRSKVEAGEIDENNYKKIQDEIAHQKQLIKEKEANRVMPTGVIKASAMAFILEKEIARANRYDYSFSALAFSMVKIRPRSKAPAGAINNEILMETVLALLSQTFREVDIVGQLGKNTIVAVLPLINREDSKKALNRVMKALQDEPIDVNGVPVDFKFAGIAISFDGEHTPDGKSFIRVMSGRLQDMANRLKNIQSFM